MKDTRRASQYTVPNAAATLGTSMQYMALGTYDWFNKLDKRPADRSQEDIAHIFTSLQNLHALERLHPSLLKHLSNYGLYEAVEKNVTLFREGESTRNWYAVVEGRLRVIRGGQNYVVGKGAVFEEITGYDSPRKLTVVTKESCQLIRLEKKHMKLFCKSYPYQLKDVTATTILELNQIERPSDIDGDLDILAPPRIIVNSNHLDQNNHTGDASHPNSAGFDGPQSLQDPTELALVDGGEKAKPQSPPLTENQAALLLTSIIDTFPDFIYPQLGRKHCITAEHIMAYVADQTQSPTILDTIGICQVLLEDAVIKPLDRKTEFVDFQTAPNFVYFFPNVSPMDSIDEDELQALLDDLIRHGSGALLRLTLRKHPDTRTEHDLEYIYNEFANIEALRLLNNSMRKELAKVVVLESHNTPGTVLFNQGDEGKSWFIILKGSVNVAIYGKGVVCSLHEGDDFGKLALVNDEPRAASIILREACHFLRVDKNDFNRILQSMESNTVRLKEHGQEVLTMQKFALSRKDKTFRYNVMSGTAEKVLEYILDSRMDDQNAMDNLLENYLQTYIMFITTPDLCNHLMVYYNSKSRNTSGGDNGQARMVLNRKHVVNFVNYWYVVDGNTMFQKVGVHDFLMKLASLLYEDSTEYEDLKEQYAIMMEITEDCQKFFDEVTSTKVVVSSESSKSEDLGRAIRPSDESIVKIYNGVDNTYTAVRIAAETRASAVLRMAAKKLGISDVSTVVLSEIKSNGEYSTYKDDEMSIETKLSINGRLFCCTKEQLAHLNPLLEQQGPNEPSGKILETVSSKELAYHSTMYDWQLFRNLHESELLYNVLGRTQGITSNLDRLMYRHNQVSFWVATEICLTASQSKRVHLLKKFIKAAQYCKEYNNLFGFSAFVAGINNSAVAKLVSTWEKLPNKFKKMAKDFETMIDPIRNHRSSRSYLSSLTGPVIPFLPLFTKDLAFAHEGNRTFLDEDHRIVNFEKMSMISETLRRLRACKSAELDIPMPSVEKVHEFNMAVYVRNLKAIDSQRRLSHLAQKREKKTVG